MEQRIWQVFEAVTRIRKSIDLLIHVAGMHKSELITLMTISNCTSGAHEDASDDGVSVSKLSKEIGVTKAGVSQVLSILDQKNLIQRCPDPADRRVVLVTLTDKGQLEIRNQRIRFEKLLTNMFDGFSSEQADDLVNLLDKVSSILLQEAAKLREETGIDFNVRTGKEVRCENT